MPMIEPWSPGKSNKVGNDSQISRARKSNKLYEFRWSSSKVPKSKDLSEERRE